jgi:hypothetical protein
VPPAPEAAADAAAIGACSRKPSAPLPDRPKPDDGGKPAAVPGEFAPGCVVPGGVPGRAAPSLPTLVVVAAALGDLVGEPVSLADLFGKSGTPLPDWPVAISGDGVVVMNRPDLQAALLGEPVKLTAKRKGAADAATRLLRDFRESDIRMCRNIGVPKDVGAAAMARLWKRPFSVERDRRAGPEPEAAERKGRQQRKGQISRQLKAELLKELADGR